ncbi:hypothetical protein C8F04DRAFT_582547 [Mycena alexandri]|uniref:Cytochrome c oxidase assembly factor 3 n=1 Tax=Mycena alexandri TaxID=1745969 RepID=A0AAD6SYM6_9AGAR|nr:hypothetical protein C8F04DRAFT_582547 [Mycena alexandri]
MHPSLPTRAWWQPDSERYVNRKEARASYWKNGRMSPGLLRARRQYRMKNALVGGTVLTFVVGVFWYSMAAVKQEVFDDMDDDAQERAILEARRGALSVEDEKRAMVAAAAHANTSTTAPKLSDRARNITIPGDAPERRGVLVTLLDGRFPWLLDPTRKTLVWGAPPVDKIGRVGDKPKMQ